MLVRKSRWVRQVRWLVTLVLPAAVLLAAILGGPLRAEGTVPEASESPPAISYGEARCANCKMFVREPDHAAALTAEGTTLAFCDVGCLLIYMKQHHPAGQGAQAVYIRDWASGEWMTERPALFAQADLWTPMRFGLFAFRDEEAAAAFALEHHGRTLTWHEATQHALGEMMKRRGQGHGGEHGSGHGQEHGGSHAGGHDAGHDGP